MNISCEIPSENTCVHGLPVNYECERCNDKHRINLLESQIKALTNMYKEISCMAVSCNDHKIRQIDENRKISRRIEKLEERLNRIDHKLVDNLNNIFKEMKELKESYSFIIDNKGLINRIGILGEALHTLSEENNKLRKAPHKCPICLGEIKILIDPNTPLSGINAMFGKRDENGMYYKNCKSCEGKGIIWV